MKAEPQAPGVLAAILASTAGRVARLASDRAGLERRAALRPAAPGFGAALRGDRVAVIAEVKRRSPSLGDIRPGADAVSLAARFAEGGATAISVLTEPEHFGGSIEDLSRVADAVRLPVLRKDFIIDVVQLYEARAAGASAVLLIARALTPEQLAGLAGCARTIGLDTLIEIHDASELAAALAAGPSAVGVNARDLETLAVDATGAERLLAAIPAGLPAVAESGLVSREDVERVARAGADAVLVGTALAGTADPAAAVAALTGVRTCGRAGVQRHG